MKKLLTVVFAMLLAGSLAFAQTGAGSTDTSKTKTTATGKKATKTKKGHKGGKKGKKGGSTSPATTTPPK